jgi:uncharacterized coiled-coil DUF342 family protein
MRYVSKPRKIEAAEQKYRVLILERNKFNEEARTIKNERDELNTQKRLLLEKLANLKNRKVRALEALRTSKENRNKFKKEARELIKLLKEKKKTLLKGLPEKLARAKLELEKLEYSQQTQPWSLEKERKIIEKIKTITAETKNLEITLELQEKLQNELVKLSNRIGELFDKASKEHEKTIKFVNELQELRNNITSIANELTILVTKTKKKHEEFLTAKQKADEFHRKAIELKTTLIALRKEEFLRKDLEKRALKRMKKEVESRLTGKKELEKFVDQALKKLVKKGKIEL